MVARIPRLVVVQARMGSSRLPGKVMLDLGGRPVLARMMERLLRAGEPDGVVVATTTQPADDVIAALCADEGWECFRGHATDLLDRHYRCAEAHRAAIVAKVPSDVPLIDPSIVDAAFRMYDCGQFEFVSNLHPATFPDGQDVEVFGMDVLRMAWREASKGFEREHTTPFMWDHPERFRLGNLATDDGADYSRTHRWTIDYVEDFHFLRGVFDTIYLDNPAFTWKDLIAFLTERPDIAALNAHLNGVIWYGDHLEELKHVDKSNVRIPPR